jgi:hypothetical protein
VAAVPDRHALMLNAVDFTPFTIMLIQRGEED